MKRIETQTNKKFSNDKERILRRTTTTTYEYVERPIQRCMVFDRRNCLSKLSRITDYLRELGYGDEDHIQYDDVVFAIENVRGVDDRTTRKYLRLLTRHDYLKPVSTRPSQIVYAKKFVSVRTGHGTRSREYQTVVGFKFYVFGPKAPKAYRESLIPSTTSLPRRDEGCGGKNMCVSRKASSACQNGGVHVGKASLEAIEGEKKEEELVLHTHILNSVIDKNAKKPKLSKQQLRILEASTREGD